MSFFFFSSCSASNGRSKYHTPARSTRPRMIYTVDVFIFLRALILVLYIAWTILMSLLGNKVLATSSHHHFSAQSIALTATVGALISGTVIFIIEGIIIYGFGFLLLLFIPNIPLVFLTAATAFQCAACGAIGAAVRLGFQNIRTEHGPLGPLEVLYSAQAGAIGPAIIVGGVLALVLLFEVIVDPPLGYNSFIHNFRLSNYKLVPLRILNHPNNTRPGPVPAMTPAEETLSVPEPLPLYSPATKNESTAEETTGIPQPVLSGSQPMV